MSGIPPSGEKPKQQRSLTAFTLVELLVVIGIIAVLISILLPSLGKAQQQARTVQCMSNLRQIGMCYQEYVIENKGHGLIAYFADTPQPPATAFSQYWFASVTTTGSVVAYDPPTGYLAKYYLDPRVTDCPALNDEANPAYLITDGQSSRVAYAFNDSNIPSPQKFALIEDPASTYALYDAAGFGPAGFSIPITAIVNSSRDPNFQGRHSGGMGNVLWYDGHVTSERPYICSLSTSYSAPYAAYVGSYSQAHIGMLAPFTPSQVPESTIVYSAAFNGATPTNLNYYSWWNKDNEK